MDWEALKERIEQVRRKGALEELRALLGDVREHMRSIAESDGETLTEDQDEQFRLCEIVLDGYGSPGLLDQIEDAERRAEVLARADRIAARGGTPTERGDDGRKATPVTKTDPFDTRDLPPYGPGRDREMRSRTLGVIESSRRFVSDDHREQATKVVERIGSQQFAAEFVLRGLTDEYADGFLKALTEPESITPDEQRALSERKTLARAMGLSDVTGVLVPSHLDTMLILANDGRANPFRQVCRVETGTTNVYRSVRTSGVTASWDAEAAEVSDDAPSFANPTATAYKGAVFVPISIEAFEDARGRESEIVDAMQDAVDDLENTAFTTGNGTSAPRGLITALDANTQAEVKNTTSNVFGIEDVYALYEDLGPRYRNQRTVWFANIAILNDIRQFGTDTFHSQTVQLGARQVPAILGHAALEASAMDSAIVAATQEEILVVGDPSTYLIYDRLGTSVELIPHLFATANNLPSGQRGWYGHFRTGANLTVGEAANTPVGFRVLLAVTN